MLKNRRARNFHGDAVDIGIAGVMTQRPNALERALFLASSGEIKNLTALRTQLRHEGYGQECSAIWGKHLKMQLSRLIAEAKARAADADDPVKH